MTRTIESRLCRSERRRQPTLPRASVVRRSIGRELVALEYSLELAISRRAQQVGRGNGEFGVEMNGDDEGVAGSADGLRHGGSSGKSRARDAERMDSLGKWPSGPVAWRKKRIGREFF